MNMDLLRTGRRVVNNLVIPGVRSTDTYSEHVIDNREEDGLILIEISHLIIPQSGAGITADFSDIVAGENIHQLTDIGAVP